MEDDRRGIARYQALAVAGLVLAVLAPSAPSDAATGAHRVATSPGPRSSHGTELVAGTELMGGSWLESSNGHYRLAMQADGNLVLSWEGHPLWASNTAKHPGALLAMQADGDLVVYQGNRPIWTSGTDRGGNARYYLSLQDNGNVTIYSPARKRDLDDEHRGRRGANRARGWHRARGWVLARSRRTATTGSRCRPTATSSSTGRGTRCGLPTPPSTPGPSWRCRPTGTSSSTRATGRSGAQGPTAGAMPSTT